MNATVSIICYKSKTLANEEHPLMIRVSKDNKMKYVSLGISVKSEHWDFKINRPTLDCPNRELILKIILQKEIDFQKKILEFNSDEKDYSVTSLIEATSKKLIRRTVSEFYKDIINYCCPIKIQLHQNCFNKAIVSGICCGIAKVSPLLRIRTIVCYLYLCFL